MSGASAAGLLAHPVWLVGFRPFFTLAFVSGALLPLVWALAYAGGFPWPEEGLNAQVWHAHEMFYGFGWAVMGGFLLTASKNWVKIRGMHGGALAAAVALWLFERWAIFLDQPMLRTVAMNAFIAYLVGYLVWTLVRYHERDFFEDNWFFVIALPLFVAAKNLLLTPEHYFLGVSMTLGLFRVAFAVMFERTMPQFMRNAMGVRLPLRRWVDLPIKSLVLLSVFEALMPAKVGALLMGVAALLSFARFFTWSPWIGMRRFEIGIMYVGYLGLVVNLALAALARGGIFYGFGTLATHAFTFLCMGLIIPPMFIRISQGHTGRPLLFTRSDRLAIGAMGLAAFFRLVATQIWPEAYLVWVSLSAIGWSLCFAVVGWRVIPFLWKPRVDGRVH